MISNTTYKAIKKDNRIKRLLVVICCIAVLLAVLPPIANTVVERTIKEKLHALPPELSVNFSAVHSNILASSVTFVNIHIRLQPYKQLSNHYDLYTKQLKVSGIALLKILWSNALTINDLQLDKTEVRLDSFLLQKKDSAQTKFFSLIPVHFKAVSVQKFAIQQASVWMQSGATMQLLTRGALKLDEISLNNIQDRDEKQFHFATIVCLLRELHYSSAVYRYALHTGSILINSKAGDLIIDSLRVFTPFRGADNSAYQASTQIHTLQLKHWDVHRLLQHQLTADSLLIDDISLYVHKASKEILAGHLLSVADASLDFPFMVSIKGINIQHSAFNYNSVLQARGSINISDFHNAESDSVLTGNSFQFSAIRAVYNRITFYTGTPARTIQINGLLLDSRQAQLLAKNITVHTNYSKQQLASKLGYQADWIDGSIKAVSLHHLDINALLKGHLSGAQLVIQGVYVYVYRDRRLPRRKIHQPMPADLLKHLPADIRIHTVTVNDASIEYDEMPEDGFKEGALRIQNMHVSISPFINHPQGGDPRYIHLYTTASLMGSGSITAMIDMPLKQNIYRVKGAIQNLDLTTLNSSAENLGKFHIQSGILNNLLFNFSFTAKKSSGKIVGEYHDLIVQKLNKKRKEALLPSLALRYIIIPKNKGKSKPVAKRTGRIDYTRDDTRFISFFLVKSLLTGIRSSFTFGFLLPE